MRQFSKFLIVGLFFLLPFTARSQSDSGEGFKKASIIELENKVEVLRSGAQTWDPGRTNQFLLPGDQIRTGEKSRAVVRLPNQTTMRLGELSLLQIPAEKKSGPFGLKVLKGLFYFFHRGDPDDLEVGTPTVSAVVRGTEFQIEVSDQDTTTLTMLNGRVDVSSDSETATIEDHQILVSAPGSDFKQSAIVNANHVIQWALFYPGILDLHDIQIDEEFEETAAASLASYRNGNLPDALVNYPSGRQPVSADERIYYAAILLTTGQVDAARDVLSKLDDGSLERIGRVRDALQLLIDVVTQTATTGILDPQLASEWMAQSYFLQARLDLRGAKSAALNATTTSPNFGFAWARLAELQFSFADANAAESSLRRSLSLMPLNAQSHSLNGFVATRQGSFDEALVHFETAIAVDGSFANAWLGRGLCLMHGRQTAAALDDLQTAATLEPNRSILRSYLAKGFSVSRDNRRAIEELHLAMQLDPNDPTGWIYAALIQQQENRINTAITNLQHSVNLNDNRAVYRSRMLLDEDRAVRSANLAGVYRDAGMRQVSINEASRAVDADYANFSSHLFLANSYNELRDPKQVTLRYETAAFSEYLMANLLSPVSVGVLSPSVSQNEYSRMFDNRKFGVSSRTEYLSGGDWIQDGAQFGNLGNVSYSVGADYRSENGQRPNNDLEALTLSLQTRIQLTPDDQIFLMGSYYNYESGDVAQYYYQTNAHQNLRVEETQEPLFLAGYNHRWSQNHQTLALFNYSRDNFKLTDTENDVLLLARDGADQVLLVPVPTLPTASIRYETDFDLYSGELQHIWKTEENTLVVGGKFQSGTLDTHSQLGASTPTQLGSVGNPPTPLFFSSPPTDQTIRSTVNRASIYVYDYWQVWDPFRITVGIAYDYLDYPVNFQSSPIESGQTSKDQWSPKVGLTYMPFKGTFFRGNYARSLGGATFDQSIRLEPVQIAGFNQAYRNVIPESIVGSIAAPSFETFGVAWDQHFRQTRSYITVIAEVLRSDVERQVGEFDVLFPPQIVPSGTQQQLDYEERNLSISFNQLISRDLVFNARYKVSDARLENAFVEIPGTVAPQASADQNSILHEIALGGILNHPSGFFSSVEGVWYQQSNRGFTPDTPGDTFWQVNLFAGYRFLQRRVEVSAGVLNLTDQDYRLNPLNFHADLRRERTFVAGLRFYF